MRRLPPLVLLLLTLAAGCRADRSDGASTAAGATAVPTGADAVSQAAALLDTDRPWAATRLLRRVEAASGLGPQTRLLAARAEAGRGDWGRVHALLDGVAGLDTLDGGRGRYLLARADDEADRLEAARDGYDAFLESSDSTRFGLERDAARLRRALVLARLDPGAGEAALARVPAVSADWLAVLEAEALARDGATERVEALVGDVTAGARGRRAWAARIEAARRAGRLDAAGRLAERARARAGSDEARAAFALTAGRIAAERGLDAEARALYRAAVEAAPPSPAARDAAALLRAGDPAPADWLALAQTDRALGLNGDAADAFGRWLEAGLGTPAQRADAHYERADALFDAQRYDEVEAALAPIAGQRRARELWAGTLSRMGRSRDAARVYLALAEADPAPNLYFAADALDEGGDVEGALALYRRVEAEHAGTSWAELATLRRAGHAFLMEDFEGAARLWSGVRSGRHALRAAYWTGRALQAAGDTAAAAERFRDVRGRERDSYYALLASEALGEPFWPLPMGPSPPDDPAAAARVEARLRGVDLLREAGFPDAAEAALDRVVAGVSGTADRYALAEALIARGYGRRAILIGQGLGGGANERRLRILYPFPHRRMIAAEAEAKGLDPFVAAALIRQESQFSERATSHVGARGLMQLMPATARTLAAEAGLEAWDPALLYLPEVNVHLGTRYVAQQVEAYDGSLPAVFGAYNAGPHQVDRWNGFPEFGDDALFAERIPFRETRDYVKILTRNRAVYEGLYGGG